MDSSFMRSSHRTGSPLAWPLAPCQAVTLAADAAPRALWVHEGRVWLTRRADGSPPEDIWLDAGQSHPLPAGSVWVAEAWPRACVSLVQGSPELPVRGAASFWARRWRAVARRQGGRGDGRGD